MVHHCENAHLVLSAQSGRPSNQAPYPAPQLRPVLHQLRLQDTDVALTSALSVRDEQLTRCSSALLRASPALVDVSAWARTVPERVELTATDVAWVRVGAALGPFAETVLAYGALASGQVPSHLRDWADTIRPRRSAADRDLGSFLWLSPTVAFDLFTVVGPHGTLAESRDVLLNGDGDVFAVEADFWAAQRRKARQLGLLPEVAAAGVSQGLRDGGVVHHRWLFDRVAAFHAVVVADRWPAIHAHLVGAQARLAHRLAADGIEAALRSLGDRVRWTGSTLELPHAGVTARCLSTIHLGGRGLVITPSFFALKPSLYLPTDPSAPAVLITPSPSVDVAVRHPPRLHGELLGATRTAVLVAVGRRSRTTELSRDLGIAIGGASEHASVLRRSGLITSTRDGGRVVHALTELGDDLLRHLFGRGARSRSAAPGADHRNLRPAAGTTSPGPRAEVSSRTSPPAAA